MSWIYKKDGEKFELTPCLRFVNRDGKKILQQMSLTYDFWKKDMGYRGEEMWFDVVEEVEEC